MTNYIYKKPLIPALHRCKNCCKRLSKHDKIVADYVGYYNEYDLYCSKECAKSFKDKEELEIKECIDLNDFISGDNRND